MSKIGAEVNHILRDIKLKKQDAFERLIAMTYNHLKVVAFNYLKDKNDVEDVVNEAYLRVDLYIDSVDLKKDGYNWICKIVENLCYDYNKRKENNAISISRIEEGKLFYEIDEGLCDHYILNKSVRTLDEMQQSLLYYKFWEGYSLFELAKKFNMKKSTVNKRLKKIFKILEKNVSDGEK